MSVHKIFDKNCGLVRPMLSPNPEIPCPRPRSLGKVRGRGQLLGKIWGQFEVRTALKFRGEYSPFPENPQKSGTRTREFFLGKIWGRGQVLGKVRGHFGVGTPLKLQGKYSPIPENPQKSETKTR